MPWRINIITYDPPMLSNATGTTSAFAIPTQFRGDQLATMEAKYADGSGAGPQNWTSYKEFGRTFTPDYTRQHHHAEAGVLRRGQRRPG